MLATLSAGHESESADRIADGRPEEPLHAVRTDGVIVKPDTPLVPLVAMYSRLAAADESPRRAHRHGALRHRPCLQLRPRHRVGNVALTTAQVGVPRDGLCIRPTQADRAPIGGLRKPSTFFRFE